MNKMLGSTELLRNSGESANVPGAADDAMGLNSATLITAVAAMVLKCVFLIIVVIVISRNMDLENAPVVGSKYHFRGIGIATGSTCRNLEHRDIARAFIVAVSGHV